MTEFAPGFLTDVPGIQVGHASDQEALTGCTVVLCPDGAIAGGIVRGLAPGTRETALLKAGALVREVHAVLLTGGSAFGLAAADGIMRYCEEHGIGFDVGGIIVPIVPGAVLFDLGVGAASIRPDAAMGYTACQAASSQATEQGNVGAGTGATVGKLLGMALAMKGGLGMASLRVGAIVIAALVVVNALGDVIDPSNNTIIAGARTPGEDSFIDTLRALQTLAPPKEPVTPSNTVIGVIATRPAHTLYDGDTFFALATGQEEANPVVLNALAAQVTGLAILNGVLSAKAVGDLPSARSFRSS